MPRQGADPAALETNLNGVAPYFHVALGLLLFSSIIGALSTLDRSPASGGIALKWVESIAWVVSSLIALGLSGNYQPIDSILAGGLSTGAADPAKLAGAISTILFGQLAWSGSLGLLGIFAILGTALTKANPPADH